MKHLTRLPARQACNKKNKGFSLLEVLIAIFIITIGITGAVNLVNYSISSVAIAKSQIIAASLAQEGTEIIRNIRDSNWLKDLDWDNGLADCASGCRVQYDGTSLLALGGNPVLKIDSNGFYQYDSGNDTLFHRKITITTTGVSEMEVISEVTWNERGRSLSASAETKLYDWK